MGVNAAWKGEVGIGPKVAEKNNKNCNFMQKVARNWRICIHDKNNLHSLSYYYVFTVTMAVFLNLLGLIIGLECNRGEALVSNLDDLTFEGIPSYISENPDIFLWMKVNPLDPQTILLGTELHPGGEEGGTTTFVNINPQSINFNPKLKHWPGQIPS